jgi:integrase
MPSVKPHPGGGFRVQVAKVGRHGKVIRASKVLETERLAKMWGLRLEQEIEEGRSDERHTLAEALDEYAQRVSSTKAGEVWERRRLEALKRHFGDIAMGEVQARHIAAWRDARLRSVSASTVVREANLLRHVFTVARLDWQWITHRPFEGVKMPKHGEPRDAVWRWKQIKLVLRYQGGPKTREVIDAFHISLRTAMRLQEVLAAPGGFDKASKVVTLHPDQTKSQRREYVPVGRIAARLLDREPFTVGANEASTLFAKLCRQLLIEGLTFHDARATALTLLARKVDVMTLAKISRHKDIRILQNTYYRESASDIAKRL